MPSAAARKESATPTAFPSAAMRTQATPMRPTRRATPRSPPRMMPRTAEYAENGRSARPKSDNMSVPIKIIKTICL